MERKKSSWYWRNEPNIPIGRELEEYLKTYDYAADGAQALSTVRIGGCDITGGGSVFLSISKYCPSDTNYNIGSVRLLISYYSMPRVSPVVNGTVVMNAGTRCGNIRDAINKLKNFRTE
jgi:hypothetical protein